MAGTTGYLFEQKLILLDFYLKPGTNNCKLLLQLNKRQNKILINLE